MTDNELLKLAAKAAGIAIDARGPWVTGFDEYSYATREDWNPLTDDGDAFRLAVQLDIDLSFYSDREAKVYAQTKHLLGYGTDDHPSYQAHEYHEELYKDSHPYAATRRAIVRAAAEIGKAMV